MEHIPDKKYSCFFEVTQRNNFFGEPFKKFVSSLPCFDRRKILNIVCNNELWSVISMSNSASGLIHRYNRNTSLRSEENDGRSIEFISLFSKRSQVFGKHFIIDNLFFQISHIHFRLCLGLSNNDNKFVIVLTKNAPKRKSSIDNGRLAGSSECHDRCKEICWIFDKMEYFFMKPCHGCSDVVSEIYFEEELETFTGKSSSDRSRFLYGSHVFRIYRIFFHSRKD